MPRRNLDWVTLKYLLNAVDSEIKWTQAFIDNVVDPERVDAIRAVLLLETLERAKKKLEDTDDDD